MENLQGLKISARSRESRPSCLCQDGIRAMLAEYLGEHLEVCLLRAAQEQDLDEAGFSAIKCATQAPLAAVDAEESFQVVADCFGICRDACVECPQNQAVLASAEFSIALRGASLDFHSAAVLFVDECARLVAIAPFLKHQKRALQSAIHFLCNLVAGNAPNATLLWRAHYPDDMMRLCYAAQASSDSDLLASACALVYTLVAVNDHHYGSSTYAEKLARHRSFCLLLVGLAVPNRGLESPEASDSPELQWIMLLFRRWASSGCLPTVFDGLGVAGILAPGDFQVTPEQLVLLHLSEAVFDDPHGLRVKDGPHSEEEALKVAYWLGHLSEAMPQEQRLFHADADMPIRLTREIVCRRMVEEARTCALKSLGGILSRCSDETRRAVAAHTGIVPTCIKLLQGCGGAAEPKKWKSLEPMEPQEIPPGRKTDVVRVLANACFQCKIAQTAVRQAGSLPLVLSHCHIDHANPLLREWALVCVRNLCEGCEENAAAIAELEIQSPAPSAVEFLQSSNMEIKVNKSTGRLELQRT